MTAVEQKAMGDIGEYPDQPLQDRQMMSEKVANNMIKDNIQPFGMDKALCSDLKTAGADLEDTEDDEDIKINGDSKSEDGGSQHQHENGPRKENGPPEDVACSECHGQFTSLQTYMEHRCKASKFSSQQQNESVEECDTAGESDGAVSMSGDESELSDMENFEGEIVYRPDGSAYLVDGSELSDNESAQHQSTNPPSVDRQPLKDTGNMSAYPGIVNSLHVPAYMTIGNLAQFSMGQLATPIVHSFRVYDVRTGKENDQESTETKPQEEEHHSVSENAVEGHGKPILMCFLCKLSFGFAKSFVAHASNDHKLTLNEEERKIMARKGQSAIVQGLGKEKSPLLSFLEATAIKSQPSHLPNFKHTPPSSEYLQTVFPSATSSVSYVYPVNVTISTSSPLTTTVTATSSRTSHKDSVVAADVDTVSGSGSEGLNVPEKQAPPGLLAIAKSETDSSGPNKDNSVSLDNENNTKKCVDMPSAEQSEILNKDCSSPENSHSAETAEGSFAPKKDCCKPLADTALETSSPSFSTKYLEPRKADVRQSPSPSTSSNCQTPHQQEAESPYPGSLAEESSSPRPSSRDTCTPSDCCASNGKISSSVECPKCDMVLGSSRSLGGHMTMMHSRNSCKTLKCPKCNWHYKYQQTLEAHMKEKHPESESKCPYCETNQTHPRLSRGETYTCGYKPYRCDICNYSTTTKGNLSIHMQSDKHLNNVQELQNGSDQLFMHTSKVGGEMPPTLSSTSSTKAKPKHTWRCDVCDYETNVARNLRIHMTSEKHIHNMMAIQQNVSQMQREMQTNLTGFQPEESMYMYMAQNMLPIMAQGAEGMDMQSMMNYNYDPAAYAAMMGSMALGVAPTPDQPRMQEEQASVSPDDLQNNEPLRLYQCSVCNKFSTDCLGTLQQHISRDRSEPNEELWRIIIGDVQQCALCNYTTQVKANFQLHMKTDKHQQKLQLFNHIREGGKQNEWRLKYMNVGNPIQLRCNACDYYTYSTDKLHTHTHSSNYRHETSMKLFRHLQKINITINPESRTFHCPLCNYSTKAKLNLIQHVQSLQHIKNEEKLTKASPKEGLTADGALDLSRKDRPSPTSTASTPRDQDKETGEPEAKRPKLPQESSSSGRPRTESRSNPNTTQIYSCPYCKYSSIDQQRISAHVVSQHSIKPQPILRCPLCQEVCTNKINLEVHLMDAHSVSRECMQRLMLTSEWVMPTTATPPATTPPFIQGTNPAMEALAQAGLKPPPAESPAPPSIEPMKMELQEKPARESPGPSSDTESTDLYRCQKCHLVFANIDQLYAHQDQSCPLTEQDTPGGPGFLCWKKGCNQYFKTASALQMHFKEIHAKRQQSASSERHMYKFRCTQCSLAFKTEEKLNNHMQYHLLRAATKCPVCQRMFRSVPALQNHIETSHQDLSNAELLQYYNSVSNGDMVPPSKPVEDSPSFDEVPNENEQVDRLDPSQDESQMEAESVDGTIDSSDAGKDDAGRQVETPNSQEVDSLSEDGSQDGSKYIDDGSYTDPVRKYKCHRCRLGFMRQSELSSHNKTMMHRKGDRSLTAFQLQRYWDPNRPYKCDVCKESFTQKNILLVHYNSVSHLHKLKQSLNEPTETEASVETGDGKPYRCNLCKVAYSQATTLETHMRSVLHQSRAAKQELQGTSTEREEATLEQNSSVENGELTSPKAPGYSTPQQVQEIQAQQLQHAQAAQQMQLQMQQIQLHQLQQLQQAQLQHFLQQQGVTQIQSEAAQQLQAELALATLAGFPPGMMLQPGQMLTQPCVYSCNKCSSVFVSQEALAQHQQTQCRSAPSSESATTPATPPATPKPGIPEASINQHPRRIRTSQVQRKLLESYGFDLVQQFNEFAQGLPASIAQEDKFYCSECSKEFSSIFVYKAHLEELHKKVLTIKEIEMYSKKFKDELLENNVEDEDKTENDKQDKDDKQSEKQIEQNGEVKEEPNTDGSTHTQMTEEQHIAAQLAAVQYLQQTQQGQMSASQSMPPPPPPQMLLSSAFPLSMMQSMQPLPGMQNFSGMMQGITPSQATMPAMQAVQYVDPNYMQKSPKRARTRITDDQLKILRAYFDINNSPTEEQIAEMSQKSGLPHKVIKHWFRNTLFKERQRNKDSPYNFNNPPTTTLQDVEKSAQLKAKQEVAAAQAAALAAEQAAAACAAAAAAAAAASATASATEAKQSSPAPVSGGGGYSNRKRSRGGSSYFSDGSLSLSTSVSTPIPVISLPSAPLTQPSLVRVPTATPTATSIASSATLSSPPAPPSERDSSPKPEMKKINVKQELVPEKVFSEPEQPRPKSPTPPPADLDTPKDPKTPPAEFKTHIKSENSQQKSPIQRDRESMASVSSVNSVFTSESQTGFCGPLTTTSSPTTPTSTYSELASPILSPISPAQHSMPSATSPTRSCSGSGTKRSGRTRFTDYQVKVLQEFFENNAYPKDDDLDNMSRLLNLSPRVIVVWFQNARQKARKIFENQPLVDSGDSEGEGSNRYKRTPGMNYQCSKCLLVFQRFYELIRHQKLHCYKDDEGSNRSSQVSPSGGPSCTSPMAKSTASSTSSVTSETVFTKSEEKAPKMEAEPKAESKPSSAVQESQAPVVHYQCEKCSLVFPHFDQWRDHQQVHMMNMGLFGSYLPQQVPYNMMYLSYPEAMNGVTPEQYLNYLSNKKANESPTKRKFSETSDDVMGPSTSESPGDNGDQPKDKRLRTTISPAQLDVLYAKYREDSNPTRRMLDMISKEVGLKKRVVQVWFQNTRARERKGQFRLSGLNQMCKCPFCRALFKTKSALEAHIRTRHFEQQITSSQMEAILAQMPECEDTGMLSPTFENSSGSNPYSISPSLSQDGEHAVNLSSSLKIRRKGEELIVISDDCSSQDGAENANESGNSDESEIKQRVRNDSGHDSEGNRKELPKQWEGTPSRSGSESSQLQMDEDSINKESDMLSPTSSMVGEDFYENTLSEAGSMDRSEDSFSNLDEAERMRMREANKRYRTQMNQLQLKVLKHCFADYRTPTMHECELLGQEVGLPKRVVQVWFQNARAKDKKCKTVVAKQFGMIGPASDGLPDMCKLCGVKYSMAMSVRDHVFTEVHIRSVKKHVGQEIEKDSEDSARFLSLQQKVHGQQPQQQQQQQQQAVPSGQPFLPAAAAAAAHAMMPAAINPVTAAQIQTIQAMHAAQMISPQMASQQMAAVAAAAGMLPGSSAGSSKQEGRKDSSVKQEPKDEEQAAQQAMLAQQQAAAAMLAQQLNIPTSRTDQALMSYLYGGVPPYYSQMQMMYPFYAGGQEAAMLAAYEQSMQAAGMLPQMAAHMYVANPLAAAAQVPSKSTETPRPKSSTSKEQQESTSFPGDKDKLILRPKSSTNRYLCKKCEKVFTDQDSVTSHQVTACYLGQVVNTDETVEKLPSNRFLCQACPREVLITEEDVNKHLQSGGHERNAALRRSSSSSSSRKSHSTKHHRHHHQSKH